MIPGTGGAPTAMPAEQLDTKLPDGWYCRAVSIHGSGVFTKRVKHHRATLNHYLSGMDRHTDYRVIYNGFMGGWVVDINRHEGQYLFDGMAFETHLAAIIAVEIELTQMEDT